ncbi:MAG: hypothetical protein K9J16_14135 [Melioribacteraceae bacterium]|nr:hypothetical protein [Melioribacteraceae bacterium]MCF8355658.1 hypothetical protein [Melioribacteraceae bacterium]MCF8395140.1 hypothetical protein [Melioribacteraceae bacterium]MCF8420566.1 hypothetical protein [Melioribacteraceae bacterium]
MKKIFFLLIVPFIINAQPGKSLLELKHQMNIQINEENELLNAAAFEKKNTGLAILYSVILPGMGELYAGDYSTGMYFTIADGLLWGTVVGFNLYGDWQKENYQSFASSVGGVENAGKDADYYANIANYADIDQYNREQELNRDFDAVYNTNTHHWSWENDTQRREFRNLWTNSEQAYNNIRFAVGALVVNRIISAINAVRLVAAYNKRASENMSWNVSVGVNQQRNLPSSINLNFHTSF